MALVGFIVVDQTWLSPTSFFGSSIARGVAHSFDMNENSVRVALRVFVYTSSSVLSVLLVTIARTDGRFNRVTMSCYSTSGSSVVCYRLLKSKQLIRFRMGVILADYHRVGHPNTDFISS